MNLHRKKKIEFVVEAALASAILALAEEAGARGYTTMAPVAGKGNSGRRNEGDPTGVSDNVLIVVIASEAVAVRILERSQAVMQNYTGIVLVSDVEVLRDDHF